MWEFLVRHWYWGAALALCATAFVGAGLRAPVDYQNEYPPEGGN